MPKVGDYVVHEVHGIGRCLGTKFIEMGDINAEYIVVEYRNSEYLYVPVDKLDRLSRYSGSDREPRLSLIGGKDFEKIKKSVKASIKAMAIDLLDLYSQRQAKHGYKYQEDEINVYGRGSIDMKGSVAVMLTLFKHLNTDKKLTVENLKNIASSTKNSTNNFGLIISGLVILIIVAGGIFYVKKVKK